MNIKLGVGKKSVPYYKGNLFCNSNIIEEVVAIPIRNHFRVGPRQKTYGMYVFGRIIGIIIIFNLVLLISKLLD